MATADLKSTRIRLAYNDGLDEGESKDCVQIVQLHQCTGNGR